MATAKKTSLHTAMKKAAHHHEQAHKWIQEAIKHPGALHKQLGVPEGEKIPAGKISSELSRLKGKEDKSESELTEQRRLLLAQRLKGMHHGGHSMQDIAKSRLSKMKEK